MSILRPIYTYWNPTVELPVADLAGLQLTDITLARQNPSSISDGFELRTNGTWQSRSYPSYAFDVNVLSLDTGKWRNNDHTGTGFYEMRFSTASGSTGTWACNKYGGYPVNGNWGVTWFDPNASDTQFYGHTAHSPGMSWTGESIRIEVRYTSNSVMISNTTFTFSG